MLKTHPRPHARTTAPPARPGGGCPRARRFPPPFFFFSRELEGEGARTFTLYLEDFFLGGGDTVLGVSPSVCDADADGGCGGGGGGGGGGYHVYVMAVVVVVVVMRFLPF